MMSKWNLSLFCLCAAVLCSCDNNEQPLATWEEERVESRRHMEQRFERMVDSGMLADMALADIHFMNNSARLNELGELRLQRYAELLSEHGGQLFIKSSHADANFVHARVQSSVDFLTRSGITPGRIAVSTGLPQGDGMAAMEAIEVKDTQFDPNRPDLTNLISGGEAGDFGISD